MSNPFDKLFELSFKRTDDNPERMPEQNLGASERVSATPRAKKPGKSTADPATKKPKQGRRAKKASKQAKRAHKSAPAFLTSLPKASLLTPNGFKKVSYLRPKPKAGTNSKHSDQPPKEVPLSATQRRVKVEALAPEAAVPSLIKALPKRSMSELQRQWINVLAYMEKRPSYAAAWKAFHDALIAEWARRHRVALNDPDHFSWPSTSTGPGDSSQGFDGWHSEGMLSYLGYRVGSTNGASEFARRKILDAVFASILPPVNDASYVRDWALPRTASRLKRLANEIAMFARNGKRKRSADMSSAVFDWESDLRYLHRTYYVGKFGFGWPELGR